MNDSSLRGSLGSLGIIVLFALVMIFLESCIDQRSFLTNSAQTRVPPSTPTLQFALTRAAESAGTASPLATPIVTPKMPPPFHPATLQPGNPLPGENYPPK